MKSWAYEKVFWSIVWAVFLIAFCSMLFAGLFGMIAEKHSPRRRLARACARIPLVLVEDRTVKWSDRERPSFENEVADPLYGEELYRFYIAQIVEQYYPEIDPYIALAVLETESNYDPNAYSSCGAVGLMQWIPKWHAWRMEKFHLNDMWDPYTNIIVGMDLLNDLYSSTGSWREALYGYNHSTSYVNGILAKADALRGGGYFG